MRALFPADDRILLEAPSEARAAVARGIVERGRTGYFLAAPAVVPTGRAGACRLWLAYRLPKAEARREPLGACTKILAVSASHAAIVVPVPARTHPPVVWEGVDQPTSDLVIFDVLLPAGRHRLRALTTTRASDAVEVEVEGDALTESEPLDVSGAMVQQAGAWGIAAADSKRLRATLGPGPALLIAIGASLARHEPPAMDPIETITLRAADEVATVELKLGELFSERLLRLSPTLHLVQGERVSSSLAVVE